MALLLWDLALLTSINAQAVFEDHRDSAQVSNVTGERANGGGGTYLESQSHHMFYPEHKHSCRRTARANWCGMGNFALEWSFTDEGAAVQQQKAICSFAVVKRCIRMNDKIREVTETKIRPAEIFLHPFAVVAFLLQIWQSRMSWLIHATTVYEQQFFSCLQWQT